MKVIGTTFRNDIDNAANGTPELRAVTTVDDSKFLNRFLRRRGLLNARCGGHVVRTVNGDDQPEKGTFYRSDQFNFAKIGVPAMYLKAGVRHPGHDAAWGRDLHEQFTKKRYHQPSDQIDETWNLEGAVDDVRLMVVSLLRVADAPKMPEWKKGDEFEAARKKALAEHN